MPIHVPLFLFRLMSIEVACPRLWTFQGIAYVIVLLQSCSLFAVIAYGYGFRVMDCTLTMYVQTLAVKDTANIIISSAILRRT
ncbi:hypothetical protein BDR04DRAFT_762383 [Suillus decipiens]|nr:hypothetical protein BDR04DRAFT_762383 [Suillus decipiens]